MTSTRQARAVTSLRSVERSFLASLTSSVLQYLHAVAEAQEFSETLRQFAELAREMSNTIRQLSSLHKGPEPLLDAPLCAAEVLAIEVMMEQLADTHSNVETPLTLRVDLLGPQKCIDGNDVLFCTSFSPRIWLLTAVNEIPLRTFLASPSGFRTQFAAPRRKVIVSRGGGELSSEAWSHLRHEERLASRQVTINLADPVYDPRAMGTMLLHVAQVAQDKALSETFMLMIFAATSREPRMELANGLADHEYSLAWQCQCKEHSQLYAEQPVGDVVCIDRRLQIHRSESNREQDSVTLDPENIDRHYKIAVALYAKFVFGFFWPMDFQHPITAKF